MRQFKILVADKEHKIVHIELYSMFYVTHVSTKEKLVAQNEFSEVA